MRAGSVSPVRGRRNADHRYSPDIDHSDGPRRSRGFGRGRDVSRYRDYSPPPYGRGRDIGRFGRGFPGPGLGPGPFRGNGMPRGNPNVRPREGDWMCPDPLWVIPLSYYFKCYLINFFRFISLMLSSWASSVFTSLYRQSLHLNEQNMFLPLSFGLMHCFSGYHDSDIFWFTPLSCSCWEHLLSCPQLLSFYYGSIHSPPPPPPTLFLIELSFFECCLHTFQSFTYNIWVLLFIVN